MCCFGKCVFFIFFPSAKSKKCCINIKKCTSKVEEPSSRASQKILKTSHKGKTEIASSPREATEKSTNIKGKETKAHGTDQARGRPKKKHQNHA